MGIVFFREKLTTFLFSKTRRGLLALLYGRPDETFYINQLMHATGSGSGAVQRELKSMTEAGVLMRKQSGNQVYYQANPQCPIFDELESIVRKTVLSSPLSPSNLLSLSPSMGESRSEGAPNTTSVRVRSNKSLDVIARRFNIPKDRLAEYCRRHHIKKLSLFGSVLREDFRPDSDIDVLVEFDPGHVPGFAIIDMEIELSQLVGHKIDLRTAGDLSRYFRDQVVHEARLEYTDGR